MAQLVLGLAGAAVGSLFGMPQIGFAVGSMLGASLGPSQKVEGPRLADLKAPSASYGTPIAYVEGSPRLAGCIVWASDKREIATTTEQGGKGGPSVESTTYTYEIDVLILLTINEIAGVRRIWKHGELIWSAADDADEATLAASMGTTTPDQGDAVQATGQTDHWRELRVYGGGATQMPDPTYEAAVGAGNAPANRGRGTVLIEGLNLGGSGQMPVLTFEVVHSGAVQTDELVRLFTRFSGASSADQSSYSLGPGTQNGGALADGSYTIAPTNGVTQPAGILWSDSSLEKVSGAPITVEFIVNATNIEPTSAQSVFRYTASGLTHEFRVNGSLSDPADIGNVEYYTSGFLQGFYATSVAGRDAHFAIVITDTGRRVYVDGNKINEVTGPPASPTLSAAVLLGANSTVPSPVWSLAFRGVRVSRAELYTADSFTPPTAFELIREQTISVVDTPLQDVVERLSARAGLAPGDLDASALAGVNVRALAVSQVTPTRQVLEMLAQAYLYEYVESDKLRCVLRGGASAASIPFADLGASNGEPGEPLPLRRVNDIEQPAQVTVKYANVLNDFQDGAESGDRLVTDSTAVSVIELPLGMTPTEARRLADVATMDIAASMIAVGPIALTREHAALEPTDVVTLTGEQGSTFRARILKSSDSAGVRTLELTLDDATAINSAAATDSSYTSSSLVRPLADTDLLLLDIPILRDVDDAPGFYAAFGADGRWPGAALLRSVDDVEYAEVLRATDRAVTGVATTALADWTGGNVFDEGSRVTVDVGSGTLSSATRDQLINDRSRNALLIGDEIVQYRDADLQSAGVYTLTGFLRGRRGTEWAMGTHAIGDRVVLLRLSGLRRVDHAQSEIGVSRYWRGVTFGKSLSSAPTHEFADTGVALKPLAPVHVYAERDDADDIVIHWTRRTRLATRFVGTAGINVPLGEASESYSIDVLDGGNDVVRTLTSSSPSVAYSAVDQSADFGSVQSSVKVRIYQLSATVGRGYPAEAIV